MASSLLTTRGEERKAEVLGSHLQLARGPKGALASWHGQALPALKWGTLAPHGLPILALAEKLPQCIISGSGMDWTLILFLRQVNMTYVQFHLLLLMLRLLCCHSLARASSLCMPAFISNQALAWS